MDASEIYSKRLNAKEVIFLQEMENSKIGMSRHLDSSTTTQMAEIMVQHGRPSRSS